MHAFIKRKEGLAIGFKSAINLVAAKRLGEELGQGHTIVTVLCDREESGSSAPSQRQLTLEPPYKEL